VWFSAQRLKLAVAELEGLERGGIKESKFWGRNDEPVDKFRGL